MKIFGKRPAATTPHVRRTTWYASSQTRDESRGEPQISTAKARSQVRRSAAKARAEIESLVAAEREQVQGMVDEAVQAAEERLRGATEHRVDLELERIEEAEGKLRHDLEQMIREQASKGPLAPTDDRDDDSVPIQARARP